MCRLCFRVVHEVFNQRDDVQSLLDVLCEEINMKYCSRQKLFSFQSITKSDNDYFIYK